MNSQSQKHVTYGLPEKYLNRCILGVGGMKGVVPHGRSRYRSDECWLLPEFRVVPRCDDVPSRSIRQGLFFSEENHENSDYPPR